MDRLSTNALSIISKTAAGINSLHAKFFRKYINMHLQFLSFLYIDMAQVVEILSRVRQVHTSSQYHGGWCPGDIRSQGISNHDTDLVKPR